MPEDAQNRDGNSESEYRVGKGKPPLEHRWKPGQSGNPAGRPAGPTLFTVIRDLLRENADEKTLEAAAQAFITKMKAGSFPHLKEFIDREEGKVPDRLQASVDLDIDMNEAPAFFRRRLPQMSVDELFTYLTAEQLAGIVAAFDQIDKICEQAAAHEAAEIAAGIPQTPPVGDSGIEVDPQTGQLVDRFLHNPPASGV